jgi:hypothetical protein
MISIYVTNNPQNAFQANEMCIQSILAEIISVGTLQCDLSKETLCQKSNTVITGVVEAFVYLAMDAVTAGIAGAAVKAIDIKAMKKAVSEVEKETTALQRDVITYPGEEFEERVTTKFREIQKIRNPGFARFNLLEDFLAR